MNFCQTTFSLLFLSIFISARGTPAPVAVDDLTQKPNILLFLTDDWGFNDVGYYENTDTKTPFIDELVNTESLRIDKHYVLPECTVTRCALLTGRYPMRYGMQDGIIQFQSAYALSRHETLLSNEFQSQGYKTYLVGKWHVGMRNWDYTPTYRGFDTFLGFYGGLINYYDHYGQNKYYKSTVDFRENEKEHNEDNVYTLYTFTDRVLALLDESSNTPNEPFFMYVAWQGSHSPSEAPDDYAVLYDSDSNDDARQYFQAQTTLTDDMFKEIVYKLKETDLWDNTLIVFASDNGGSSGYGDNAPLRGGKFTIWEGGIRVPAFITGGYLPENRRGKVLDQFPIHVTDWYQTLLDVASLDVTSDNKLDGENMWDLIISSDQFYDENSNNNVENDNSNRKQISSKVVNSENSNDKGNEIDLSRLVDDRYILINVNNDDCENEVCGALIYGGRWKMIITSNEIAQTNMPQTSFWMRNFVKSTNDLLGCGDVPDDVETTGDVYCETNVCLFDLVKDPCEYYDVSSDYPELSDKLYTKLKEFYDDQATPLNTVFDYAESDEIDPTDTGFWHPWDEADWTDVSFEIYLSQYYENSPLKDRYDSLFDGTYPGKTYLKSSDTANDEDSGSVSASNVVFSNKPEDIDAAREAQAAQAAASVVIGEKREDVDNEDKDADTDVIKVFKKGNSGKNGKKASEEVSEIITNEQWEALIALSLLSFVFCTIYVFVSFRNPGMRYKIVMDYDNGENDGINNRKKIKKKNYQSIAA